MSFRFVLVFGPGTFVVIAVWPIIFGRSLLQYSAAHASEAITLLEIAAALSIGATLATLFLSASSDDEREQ